MRKSVTWLINLCCIGFFVLSASVLAQQDGQADAQLQDERQIQLLKQEFANELANLQKLEQYLNVRSDKYQAALKAGQTQRAETLKREYLLLKEEYDASLNKLQKLQRLYKAAEARRRNREMAKQLADSEKKDAASIVDVQDTSATRPTGQSKGVETLIQEEHALFNRRLMLEAGVTYTHSDRKQLVLNGFLALDAIFLGNIAIEGVETDIFRYDLFARYGLTGRTNLNLNIPFIQRTTTYQKGGASGSSAIVGEKTVSRGFTLADINLGISHQLLKETLTNPDIVWNLSLTAPTGVHPYGVGTDVTTYDDNGESVDMQVPKELPTGSGVWALTTGLSFVKTLDPAVIFANIGYTHTETQDFDDIESATGDQPGKVDLGNSWQYGVGLAYAFNDRLSTSMIYSQAFTGTSRTKTDDGDWQDIVGSSANSATLGLGVTYAINKNFSMVTNVGAGLTADAPDLNFSIKFPYTF